MLKLIPIALRSEPLGSRVSGEPDEALGLGFGGFNVMLVDIDNLLDEDGNEAESETEQNSEINNAMPENFSNAAGSAAAFSNNFNTTLNGEQISVLLGNPNCVRELTCPENGARVYVIGTTHFSEQSQQDVTTLINRIAPDSVVLELCASHSAILELDEATLLSEATTRVTYQRFRALLRRHGGSIMRAVLELLLQNLSAHVTKQVGMAPGGEFRAAARAAHALNRAATGAAEQDSANPVAGNSQPRPANRRCRVLLGDRATSITLQRAFAMLSAWHKFKLLVKLLMSSYGSITRKQIEEFKYNDFLVEALRQFSDSHKQFSAVLVDERDAYLATSLRVAALDILELERARQRDATSVRDTDQSPQTSGTNSNSSSSTEEYDAALQRAARRPPVVIGVVGLGHVDGIVRYWNAHEKSSDMLRAVRSLLVVPRRANHLKLALRWTLRIALLAVLSKFVLAAYASFSFAV